MANIELVYFGINGRGLLTRLLFKLGDVDFTDTIISFEDFAAMKPGKGSNGLYRVGHYQTFLFSGAFLLC